VLRSPVEAPWILRGPGVSCRVRPWPYEPRTAQMVFFNQGRAPSSAQVAIWLRDIANGGYTIVRTGAVSASSAANLEAEGFVAVQSLVLLAHRDLDHLPLAHQPRTRRLDGERFAAAARVDYAAFGQRWAVDEPGVSDICAATAYHRARRIDLDGEIAAFAISGRDHRHGFLQRLAVHPTHQHHGLGRSLTVDSLRWMHRRRVRQALVNTHSENEPALALYRSVGFVDESEPLLVLERQL
jgi:ribosomal protein S18 acetylase RimI-like enzyme